MGWTVRRATPADAQRLSEIRVCSWQHAYRDILSAAGLAAMRPADGVARWIEYIESPAPTAVFVAVGADDLPVAYSLVGAVRDDVDRHPELPTGELWAIYSDPAVTGSGAGHAVHAVGLDHLAEQGFRHAVLWVFEDNAVATLFYRAHGWAPDGGREAFDFAGASVMEVRLARPISPAACS